MPNQQEWEKAYDKIQKRVVDVVKGACYVRYSAYSDLDGIPSDNLDECPLLGNLEFVEVPDSPTKTNPTWLEIAVLANEMIKASDDKQHVFLEGIQVTILNGKQKTVEFLMGS